SLHTLSPQAAREEFRRSRRALNPDPPEVAAVEDRYIPGPGGVLRVRCYRARGSLPTDRLSALLYFPCAGYTAGALDTHDVVCRTLANEAGCAIVSVDYRLGP